MSDNDNKENAMDTKISDSSDYSTMTAAEAALIEARRQLVSARAKASGLPRLGHDDRCAMPVAAAERRLAEAQAAFNAEMARAAELAETLRRR